MAILQRMSELEILRRLSNLNLNQEKLAAARQRDREAALNDVRHAAQRQQGTTLQAQYMASLKRGVQSSWSVRNGWATAVLGTEFGQVPFAPSGTANSAVAVVPMPEMGAIATLPVEVTAEEMDDLNKQFAAEVEQYLGYDRLRSRLNAPSRLRYVLAKLEIEKLDAAQVQAYKKQAKEHMRTAKQMSDPTWTVTPLAAYAEDVPHFVLSKALEVKKEVPEAQFYVEHLQEDPFLIVTTYGKVDNYCGLVGRHGSLGDRATIMDDTMYLAVWNEKSFEEKM